MTVVDIQETQRSDLIVPRPAPRPLIVVQPEEFSKT